MLTHSITLLDFSIINKRMSERGLTQHSAIAYINKMRKIAIKAKQFWLDRSLISVLDKVLKGESSIHRWSKTKVGFVIN